MLKSFRGISPAVSLGSRPQDPPAAKAIMYSSYFALIRTKRKKNLNVLIKKR